MRAKDEGGSEAERSGNETDVLSEQDSFRMENVAKAIVIYRNLLREVLPRQE
jgi:hypothetical protein